MQILTILMIGNKRNIIIYTFIAFLLSLSAEAKNFTLVIDAGHGGKDKGALGLNTCEKNINLAVALKLGELVEDNMQDVNVVYTRNKDKYLTLQERANIANSQNGDLFISIHTNSVDLNSKNRTQVKGSATYTLGLHKSEDNLNVAKRENSVIALEDDYTAIYKGFDPNSTESYIIFEISQNAHMAQSIDFASKVQQEMSSIANRVDKGVRQAGFWVLAKTSMPAVLVELDFICNPTQEAYMSSQKGQMQLAQSIYTAFKKYKASVMLASNQSYISANRNDIKDKRKGKEKMYFESSDIDSGVKNKEKKDSKSKEESKKGTPDANSVVYKIQFLTSMRSLSSGSKELKGLSPIQYYKENGVYKYTYGETIDKKEALSLLRKVKTMFKEAFIVEFKHDKRIK